MTRPGESKEQEIHVLTLRINWCCASVSGYTCVRFSLQPCPAGRRAPTGSVRRWNPRCQSRAAVLNLLLCHDCSIRMTAGNVAAALTFKQGLVIRQQPSSPSPDMWNNIIIPIVYITPQKSISMKFIKMSKCILLILCLGKWGYRKLKWFNKLWNECRFTDSHFSGTAEHKKHQEQPRLFYIIFVRSHV